MPSSADAIGLISGRPRVLATADLSPEGIAALREISELTLLGWAAGEWFCNRKALIDAIADAEVVIAGYERFDEELLAAAPQLRAILSVRSAPEANIDVAAATARGIAVLHTVGRTDHGVAEFTVALALGLARHLIPAGAWIRSRSPDFDAGEDFYRGTVWGRGAGSPQLAFTGIELHGRTLGIVGFGAIGRVVAEKFSGFGMRIIAHDPYVDSAELETLGVEPVSLDELLARSGIVTLHARLSTQTRGMIGADQLDRMGPGAYLINTGRAGLIDTAALMRALDREQIAGAALDVFDTEPPSARDPLVTHPRVLATPHIAAWTEEMRVRHTRSIVQNLQQLLAGKPGNLSNPGALTMAGRTVS
ncbi:NAD(P)-dependent oxidoreductase [Mesorhizobium sp. AR07]|uniref:NAD(P)-dependent oxidoreductase n=1 Tax=Mesorhizobium sp. AR07 TaxID=2865838 RepID=UPI0021600783|nr:NAD(P)-dependent oxidoreductase [Mesorhizobium sp. AR07]